MAKEQSSEFTVKFEIEKDSFEEFETPKIKGNLNCFIIDSDNEVSVTIESSLGYLIFHTSQHKGIEYYAPRAVLRANEQYHYDVDNFDKFKLNETLIIRITGPSNSKVKIITRYD